MYTTRFETGSDNKIAQKGGFFCRDCVCHNLGSGTDSMSPAPDPVPALFSEIEASADSVRHAMSLDEEERVFLDLQANPRSTVNATGEAHSVVPRRSNADRHRPQDDALFSWSATLNDTIGRTNRVYQTSPRPPINRRQSTSEFAAATLSGDETCRSVRLISSEEPLNDTIGRPTRVFRTTPPRTRGRRSDMDSEETLGRVESEQAGATGTCEHSCDATQTTLDFPELCELQSGSPTEDSDAALDERQARFSRASTLRTREPSL